AILLCLAGGWPSSVPCARARAEFIRRITPWPVEPPLQIWRCPMNTSFQPDDTLSPSDRIFTIAAGGALPRRQSYGDIILPALKPPHPEQPAPEPAPTVLRQNRASDRDTMLHLAQAVGQGADINISGREFDFVRSIKVWHVQFYRHNLSNRHNTCREVHQILLGDYGTQGDYRWTRSTPAAVPAWMNMSRVCQPGSFYRAVGVEWTDHLGNHGHELVTY
ncbi:MAG: hypothetical protein WBB85_03085, partial [Albidovulum sp.]|uniref:hypothetical protein n=1 Tax=Albidovulum sp. TaxID=1872424 RepID=UPI003C80419C